MIIPLHVPLELKWQAVLIVLRNILSIGIVIWQWVPITFILLDYHYVSDSTQ